ncbi:MAG: respiratory nitrate reductase subunit gamma [Magnetospirillum sp.]|nr:respiratory nitrate reductase subunit gamma [Magnetospirillum sp.]
MAMGILLATAAVVLVVGLALRIRLYWVTPAPLRIPTMPAPLTRRGAALRVAREVVLFHSLFRGDKLLWLASMLFHAGLALVLARHLRYAFDPAPLPVVLVQPLGLYGSFAMMAGLALLLARRLVLSAVRHVSRATDYGWLLLLLAIGGSGLAMTFLVHTDIMGLKAFLAGNGPLPGDPALVAHLALVAALALGLPFSKLLHIPGIFFSPTRNQADDARDRRHVAPWARSFDEAGHG